MGSVVRADPQDIQSASEPVGQFGTVGQQSAGIVNGGQACGPTSTYNSFVYLQNQFGVTGLFQNGAASNTINQLGVDMNPNNTNTGVSPNGVSEQQLVNGKTTYINGQTLNKPITIESQVNPGGVGTNLTWEFIMAQLRAGQDVELGWRWTTGGGHVVTLTGMTWDPDLNTGTMSFLDPYNPAGGNAPALPITGTVNGTDATGFQLSYSGGAAGPDSDPDNPGNASTGNLSVVAAESVPEPIGVGAIACCCALLLSRGRRRADQAA
jgi:hypothetical protein